MKNGWKQPTGQMLRSPSKLPVEGRFPSMAADAGGASPNSARLVEVNQQAVEEMRAIEGQTVRVELRDGRRFEDCELVSSGGPGVETLWLLVDGEDILVSKRQVVTVAGAGVRGRPLR